MRLSVSPMFGLLYVYLETDGAELYARQFVAGKIGGGIDCLTTASDPETDVLGLKGWLSPDHRPVIIINPGRRAVDEDCDRKVRKLFGSDEYDKLEQIGFEIASGARREGSLEVPDVLGYKLAEAIRVATGH